MWINKMTCIRSAVSTLLTYVFQSTMFDIWLISLSFIGLYNLLAFRRSSLGNEAFANFISKSNDSFKSEAALDGSAPSKIATCLNIQLYNISTNYLYRWLYLGRNSKSKLIFIPFACSCNSAGRLHLLYPLLDILDSFQWMPGQSRLFAKLNFEYRLQLRNQTSNLCYNLAIDIKNI